MSKLLKHLPHYLPLFGFYAAGAGVFIAFSYNRKMQMAAAALAALAHIVWGIIHHRVHGDLNLIVVLEYIAFALIGFLIVFSLIIQA